jgi:hypothetical protein
VADVGQRERNIFSKNHHAELAGLTEMAQGSATRGSGKNRLARASASRLLCMPVEQRYSLMKPHSFATRWLDSEELRNTCLKGLGCLIFSQSTWWIKASRSAWGVPLRTVASARRRRLGAKAGPLATVYPPSNSSHISDAPNMWLERSPNMPCTTSSK